MRGGHVAGHRQRRPVLRELAPERFGLDELRRDDADDRPRPAADRERLADDLGIGIEAPLPETERDRDRSARVGRNQLVARFDAAAERQLDAEQCEELGRDRRAADLLGVASVGERAERDVVRRERLEGVILFLPGEVVGVGVHAARAVRVAARPQHHDAVGLLIGKRPQQHAANHRKQRGVESEADREHERDGEREARPPAERADGVAKVLPD